MIECAYRREAAGPSLRVEGHARTAPRGQDLVCAGASTLVYALAEALRRAERRGEAEAVHVKIYGDGRAFFSAAPADDCEAILLSMFDTAWAGLRVLERETGVVRCVVKK